MPSIYYALPTPRSIRLVTVFPRGSSGLIRVQLHVVSLDDVAANFDDPDDENAKFKSFVALSYACGSQTDLIEIECNGSLIKITRNLHHFLSRGDVDFGWRFWIDALCINQSQESHALQERASQVQMMGDIYSKAHYVWVELGTGTESVDILFDQALLPTESFLSHHKAKTIILAARLARQVVHEDTYQPYLPFSTALESDITTGLNEICSRLWFQRAWTAQEFVLPPREPLFLCGERYVSASVLLFFVYYSTTRDFAHIIEQNSGTGLFFRGVADFSTLSALRMRHLSTQAIRFDSIWALFGRRNATDPRDFVYAQLGMNIDLTAKDFIVDYQEDSDATFGRASAHLVETGYLSMILYQGRTCQLSGVSWRLCQPNTVLPTFIHTLHELGPFFQAAAPSRINVLSVSATELKVSGHVICAMIEPSYLLRRDYCFFEPKKNGLPCITYPMKGSTRTILMFVPLFMLAWGWYEETKDPNVTDLKPLCRTLVAGLQAPGNEQVPRRLQPQDELSFQAMTNIAIDLKQIGDTACKEEDLNLHHRNAAVPFANGLLARAEGRKLGKTDSGAFCNLPGHTQKGDVIAIICGVSYPVVLRPEGNHFLLVGPCYVDGMMDGEALSLPDWTEDEIVIR